MNDEEIIRLYLARSENAIRETELRYSGYLNKIACNILNNREDGEECVNDTYLRAWETIPPNIPAKLSYYLGKITRELSIDRLRRMLSRKRSNSEYDLSLEELSECVSDDSDIEGQAELRLLAEHIGAYLRGCTEEQRNIFICRYYFCDSVGDIAEYFGCGESKVKSSLFRARRGLKNYLEKEGFDI